MNGSGLIPRSFPLGVGAIGAGAAIPGPRGLGGGGGGPGGGPLGGLLLSSLSSSGSSPLGSSGKIGWSDGVCGDVSFLFPLSLDWNMDGGRLLSAPG